MFTHQSAGLGSQLENRERGCVVDIEWSVVEGFHSGHELVPVVGKQATAFDFLAFDFASVGNQTVHQLTTSQL